MDLGEVISLHPYKEGPARWRGSELVTVLDKGAIFSGPHRAAASRGKAAVTCPCSFREPALKPM